MSNFLEGGDSAESRSRSEYHHHRRIPEKKGLFLKFIDSRPTWHFPQEEEEEKEEEEAGISFTSKIVREMTSAGDQKCVNDSHRINGGAHKRPMPKHIFETIF